MAKAYKCDRCGKLFESYDQNLNLVKEDRAEDYVLEVRKKGRYSNAHDKIFDLCPECYEKFADFVLLKVKAEWLPQYEGKWVAESEE